MSGTTKVADAPRPAADAGRATRPTVVCLTPVRNEAWILERFLRCASVWADRIIVADQGSDDGSREIARGFEKVRLIENPARRFNEPERQRLLIEAAREIDGPRLLVALDADEFLSANVVESPEWRTVLRAPPGTAVRFRWVTVLPGVRRFWDFPSRPLLGFMDDGTEHTGRVIHSPRLPVDAAAGTLIVNRLAVMHYVGVDPERWKSKLRWYQCWEHLNRSERGPAELYRFYHKDLHVPERAIREIPDAWLRGYRERGIDMTSVRVQDHYRWDEAVIELLAEHGPAAFRRLGIWDVNWRKRARSLGMDLPDAALRDPRTRLERLVHRWLRRMQPYHSHFPPETSRLRRAGLRLADRALEALGW